MIRQVESRGVCRVRPRPFVNDTIVHARAFGPDVFPIQLQCHSDGGKGNLHQGTNDSKYSRKRLHNTASQ